MILKILIYHDSFISLMFRGYSRPLEYEDLYDLPEKDKTQNIYPIFEKHWNDAQKR